MATATFISKASNETDFLFRDWGSKLSSAIQAVGLIKTADTGQINWLTVPRSTSGMAGYEIFRFDDTLQATAPIFLKLEYGGTGNYALFKTTLGKGTDGAGNITGILHQALQALNGNYNSTTDFASYISSGDGSMLNVALWPSFHVSYSPLLKFCIDRSRDGAGNPTGLGTFMHRYATSTLTAGHRSEAADYITAQTNIINRGCFFSGYELANTTVLNNGTDTPMFKCEVITPSRVKWNPKCILGYAYADAGMLQIVNVGGTQYLTLGTGGTYADFGLQQYACMAMAHY